jgi:alkylated DNA repair dioxygenase AlkB
MFFDEWEKIFLTTDGASWLVLGRRALPILSDEFDRLWKLSPFQKPTGMIFGKPVTFPRFTKACGRDYSFSGQVNEAEPTTSAPGIEHYLSWMIDANLNGVLVNWYDAVHGDYIGPHSDDEKQLDVDAPIVSITFCSDNVHFRRFRLKPKKANGEQIEIELRNGDVVIMGGTCQSTHKHEIMHPRKKVANECTGRRINVTLRRFL